MEYQPSEDEGKLGRTIYFDMDGTLADLYGVDNVFQRLSDNDSDVFREAKPIPRYIEMLKDFKEMGYRIGIITSGPRFSADTSQDVKEIMNEATEREKKEWLKRQGLWGYIDSFQFVSWGTSKYSVASDKTGILVDDEDRVLNVWYSDKIKAINKNKARF